MNNRTRRLYIVVPLIWLVLIGAAAWVAYARTGGEPVQVEEEEDHDHDEHSLAPAGVGISDMASGVERPSWEMSVSPAREKGEARLVSHVVERRVTPLGSEKEGRGASQGFYPWL